MVPADRRPVRQGAPRPRLGGRDGEPSPDAHRGQFARGHDSGGSAAASTDQARRHRASQRKLSRPPRHSVARNADPRCSLRSTHASQSSSPDFHFSVHAGIGHRGEFDGVQRGERFPPSSTAGGPSGADCGAGEPPTGSPPGRDERLLCGSKRFSQARRGCILGFVRICAVPCRAQRRRPRPPDHGELRFRKLFFGPGA